MRQIWEDAEQRLVPSGLTMKHSWALHALDEPMSMSTLADRLGIDASYVTTIAASPIPPTGGSRAWP